MPPKRLENPTKERGFVGLEAAARYIQVSPITLKKILQERKITCTLVGKRMRFQFSDLDAYLERATRHAIDEQK